MRKVVVYKTNVEDRSKAKTIVEAIQQQLPGCEASFDLEDHDNVLRVESFNGGISEETVKEILHHYGHQIKQLP